MKTTIYLLSVWLIIGCKQPGSIQPKASLKDSVLKQFLVLVDSLEFYDTTTFDFRLLKAYMKNDTVFLKGAKKNMDNHVDSKKFSGVDDCILPGRLSDLPVDEAYRFIYGGSLCFFGQAVTISRTSDSIKLRFVKYILPNINSMKVNINGKEYTADSNCHIVNQFERSLQREDWEKLKQALVDADYWGLKTRTPPRFLDPSHWQIDAYSKDPWFRNNQQVHSVIRESPTMKAFAELGLLFMKLSGEKGQCSLE